MDSHPDRISRRRFLEAGAGAVAGAALASAARSATSAPARRPNVLFLMDDQHRGDALGVAGNPLIATPNLDRLAAEGAYFPRAYSSVPSCVAARAGLLTGLQPWGHGMLGYVEQASHWPYEGPDAMRQAGYATHAIGKNHFHTWHNPHGYSAVELYDGLPDTDGVDDYGTWLKRVAPGVDEHSTGLSWNDRRGIPWPHKPELHPTAWVGQRAVDYLQSYASDKPFFLKVSFHRPHSPFDPPAHWWDHYATAELPPAVVGEWAERQFGSFTPPRSPESARAKLPPADVRNCRQGYYGAISFVDEQVGRVLDVLRTRGMLEDTLVVFVSDHGEMAGDHHLYRKTYAYEGSARVPLIVRWGERVLSAARGQVLPQLAELRDLVPTFLDAAGVTPPPTLDGRSLLDPIRGHTNGWRTQLDLEHSVCYWKESAWTALTDGAFKYIYHAFAGQQQLFHLPDDPGELNDLSTDPAHAATLAEWRQRMVAHLAIRGPKWVKDGDLALRKTAMHRGVHFPADVGANPATLPGG
jgi:arylsulfatase